AIGVASAAKRTVSTMPVALVRITSLRTDRASSVRAMISEPPTPDDMKRIVRLTITAATATTPKSLGATRIARTKNDAYHRPCPTTTLAILHDIARATPAVVGGCSVATADPATCSLTLGC